MGYGKEVKKEPLSNLQNASAVGRVCYKPFPPPAYAFLQREL